MRIGLPHHVIAADRIPGAAEVAGDHPRGYAHGPHQRHVRRGEMAAESQPRVEQQVVDGVALQPRWRQRVLEAAVVEIAQRALRVVAIVAGCGAQFARQ